MDDRKPVHEISYEMKNSPKDNDDYEERESGRIPRTLGNQVLPSVRQDASENQQLPSGISAETSSRPSVPTSKSSSQALNINKLDETFSNPVAFYSSRKLRIRTKCSQSVDALLSPGQHPRAFKYRPEESDRNPTSLGNQVLPSVRQDASENQQLPSGISAETSVRPSVPSSASSSQARNIDQHDETFSSRGVFYFSRDLRIRTNCSRSVDALLSPRQNRSGRVDALLSPRRNRSGAVDGLLSPRQNPNTSSMPVLEHSDVGSPKINRRGRPPLGQGRNTDSASPLQPFPVRMTRSLSKTLNRQKTPTPSPEKSHFETGMGPTSAKRRRTQTPERDSGKSGTKNESFKLKLSPSAAARTLDKFPINVQTREMGADARESEASESVTRPLTPSNKKRKIMRYLEASATEERTSIIFGDCSTDSNYVEKHSNPDDLHQTRSFITLSTEEQETTIHSNIPTDASTASPNKDSGKRSKGSPASDTWFVVPLDLPKKESRSLKLRRIPSDEDSSSNFGPTSIPRNSTTEDFEPCMSVKAQESSEETQSASCMAHSATEIQMLESSQSRPIIENPDLPSSVLDSGNETRGITASPSSRVFSNPHLPLSCHLPEQSRSSDINVPHRELEFETYDETEGTDRNRSDSSTLTSEPNVTSGSESKKSSTSRSRETLRRSESDETLTSGNSPEIKDPEVLLQETRNDPLLQRQHSGPISSGVSTSRERSEVGMDLDPPYLDVCEGQPSTSSHQPVITDGSSAGVRFNSSSGVTPSGETRDTAIKLNTSTKRLSKYAANAQMLLLTVLEEVMKFNEEKGLYRRFRDLFLSVSEFPCFETEMVLQSELMMYLLQRRTNFEVQNLFTSREITLEYHTQEAYVSLIRIAVTALISTVSVRASLNFETIITNYRTLRNFYERCLQFWRHSSVEEIQDEASRNRVIFFIEMIQRLLLQTRNAFRELLMHIGEHADQGIVEMYEEELWEEDKDYLRRRIR